MAKDPSYAPTASFLILAHNEEGTIRRKLEDTLSCDYPRDRFQIIVASDGSDDGTAEIVRKFKDSGISIISFPRRRGKTAVLNDVIHACRGEIIVISDARQAYDPRAIQELVANFRNPLVGAATGNLQFRAFPDSKDGERLGLYWRYEKWIRSLQSKIDSIPVVTGAIYAIRKSCFRQLPINCIADDLAMPMNIIVYDFELHSLYPGTSMMAPGDVVIAQGLMLFRDERISAIFDSKLFIDTPADVRLRRCLERDVRERGRALEEAIDHYRTSVLPMYEHFIEPARDISNYVLPGTEDNEFVLAELATLMCRNRIQDGSVFPVSASPSI